MRNEKEDTTTDAIDNYSITIATIITTTIIEQYEQLCAHKFDNQNKMDQFLERHSLPKLKYTHKNNYLKGTISIKQIESIINNLPKHKAPEPD